MKEKKERLLRLWKIRQEQEGYDVSNVKTLEEAKHFFDKKETPVEIKSMFDMSNKELVELGKEYGLDLKANVKKEKLVAAIEEAKNNITTEETPVVEEVEVPEIKELDKDKAFTIEVDEIKEETPVEGE